MIEEMKRKCVEIETLTIGLCNEESIVKRRVIRDEILKLTRELQPKEKPQEPEKIKKDWSISPDPNDTLYPPKEKPEEPENEPPEEEGDNRDEWFDNNKCVDCIFEDFGYCDAVISEEEHSHQFDTGQCSHYKTVKTVTHCKHCEFLKKTFCNNEDNTNREYWLMTEVFVYLHGSDVCPTPKPKDIEKSQEPEKVQAELEQLRDITKTEVESLDIISKKVEQAKDTVTSASTTKKGE